MTSTSQRTAARRRFTLAGALAAAGLVLALASLQSPARAQARSAEPTTGQAKRMAGIVQDASGGMIPRARIDIRGVNDFHEIAYTGPAGGFLLDGVPDGTYDLTISKPGFARMALTGLRFDSAKPAPLELTLNVGSVQESVQVEAQGAAPVNPPASNGTAPRRIRVGGNVQAAKLDYKAPIMYPPGAKADRVQGTVVSAKPINKMVDPRLVEAALDGVKRWRYSPTLLNGQPVEILTVVEVNFTLSE